MMNILAKFSQARKKPPPPPLCNTMKIMVTSLKRCEEWLRKDSVFQDGSIVGNT